MLKKDITIFIAVIELVKTAINFITCHKLVSVSNIYASTKRYMNPLTAGLFKLSERCSRDVRDFIDLSFLHYRLSFLYQRSFGLTRSDPSCLLYHHGTVKFFLQLQAFSLAVPLIANAPEGAAISGTAKIGRQKIQPPRAGSSFNVQKYFLSFPYPLLFTSILPSRSKSHFTRLNALLDIPAANAASSTSLYGFDSPLSR